MTAKEKTSRSRKALNIVIYVMLGLLLVFDVFLLIGRANSSSNGASNFFGTEVYTVLTGSMEGSDQFYAEHPEYEIKSCPIDSALFVKRAPTPIDEQDDQNTKENKKAALESFYGQLKVGDVLTFFFQSNRSNIVTHRIIKIEKSDEVYRFTLRGDNPTGDKTITASSPTQSVSSDSGLVIGKVTGVNVPLGKFLVHVIQNKIVFGCLVLIPCGVMVLYEMGRIIYVLHSSKAQEVAEKRKEEEREKDALIRELRAKVEKLQASEDKNKAQE